MIKKTCKLCGKKFKVPGSKHSTIYCSYICHIFSHKIKYYKKKYAQYWQVAMYKHYLKKQVQGICFGDSETNDAIDILTKLKKKGVLQ